MLMAYSYFSYIWSGCMMIMSIKMPYFKRKAMRKEMSTYMCLKWWSRYVGIPIGLLFRKVIKESSSRLGQVTYNQRPHILSDIPYISHITNMLLLLEGMEYHSIMIMIFFNNGQVKHVLQSRGSKAEYQLSAWGWTLERTDISKRDGERKREI